MSRPNIIVITVDGMGSNDLAASGNPDIRTPNLNALASHGVCFTQAISCQPDPGDGASNAESGCPGAAVSKRLEEVGYQTGAVGRVPAGSFGYRQRTGYTIGDDDYAAWYASTGGHEALPSAGDERHVSTWIGNQSVRFCQSAEEPFLLVAGFLAPENPPVPWSRMYTPGALRLPKGMSGTGEELPLREALSGYYGAISHIDRQVGRMLATLTGRGRTNNVFVFTASRGRDFRKDAHDASLREALVRIPLLIGGLAGQRKGDWDPALVTSSDISATLLDALDLPCADLEKSRSALPQLGRAGASHRKAQTVDGTSDTRAVRTARYKWITDGATGAEFLFDLQTDPFERENLIGKRQAFAIKKMLAGLAQESLRQEDNSGTPSSS
jgi:arylsulfatase A-like enzyme